MKPSTTLTAVSVSRMPTLNASSALAARAAKRVDEERLLGADPARAHRKERGEALRRLHEQHVAKRLVDPEGVEHEPDRRQAEAPVAELPEHHLPQPARGVRTIVNAWPTRSLNSATCALTQIISAISPNTTASRTSSPIRSCSKSQRKSKLGSDGSESMLGSTPCVSAQPNSDRPRRRCRRSRAPRSS